jgi:hypothetical protein
MDVNDQATLHLACITAKFTLWQTNLAEGRAWLILQSNMGVFDGNSVDVWWQYQILHSRAAASTDIDATAAMAKTELKNTAKERAAS